MTNISKTSLSNRLLLLWLLHDAMKFKQLGDTKAHKLAYLSELEMVNQHESGFNYDFKKLPFGPFSDELKVDVDWLEEQQLIDSRPYADGKLFSDSRFGTKLLSDFSEMFVRNNEFTRKIYAVNCKYAIYGTHELVNVVHRLKHPYRNMTINDAPIGDLLLTPMPDSLVKNKFTITPEELATLEVYLDDECYKSAMSACYSAQRKPLLSIDEVF